mmetsp:Transcript_19602/g.29087  ORF Transcript_19602/g.29087 Transcript_19602/m.29087 type:complete len:80 (-) Transcript_19602:3694-3933(-)
MQHIIVVIKRRYGRHSKGGKCGVMPFSIDIITAFGEMKSINFGNAPLLLHDEQAKEEHSLMERVLGRDCNSGVSAVWPS